MRTLIFAIALVTALVSMLGVSGAFATTPATQQVVLAPQPGVSCGDLTPGANGTFIFQCTLTGLTAASTPSPSTSPSVTPSQAPSQTPSPTVTTPPPTTQSPTPGPTTPRPPQNGCINSPILCGFPDAANTGTTSASLVTLNGNQTFSTPGQTIANTRINGCTEVRAANITFRNVFFNASNCFWGVRQFSTNLQVFDSTITCGGGTGTAFGSSNMSLTRVEITGCENGLDGGNTMLLQDSWIHDMQTCCGAHTDGFQLGRGSADITIRHNTINMGPGPGSTGAVMIWNEDDPQARRVSVDNNLLAWGTYTIYCGRTGVVDNIRITNNRFGPAEYGYADHCGDGETWFGNVNDANGATLVAT